MTPMPSTHRTSDFRGDIEGLRAVAVLAVIGDHMRWSLVGGGYVGVDVFFVISGYLITKNLVSSPIDIADFYRRRAVRILPALLLVSLVCVPVSLVLLFPQELVAFGKSLVSAALSVPNIFFYLNIGYFSPLAEATPLLHTWSLGIEEQFYIFWPLLIMACRRIGLPVVVMIAATILVSFAVSAVSVRWYPEAAFYLLPARAWELALGGALVFVPPLRSAWLRQALAGAGLLVIAYAATRFSHGTLFPGPAALVPTLGAFAIIWAGHGGGSGTLGAFLLNLPPVRWIGRISYSLYLVHWPIMVFARLRYDWLFADPAFQALVLVVVFAAGFAVWALAENVAGRSGRTMARPRVFAAAGSAIGAVCLLGLAMVGLHGLPKRFGPEANAVVAWQSFDGDKAFRGGTCFLLTAADVYDEAECFTPRRPGRTVFLLGDSHSAHLWPGIRDVFAGDVLLQANMAGCRPTVLHVGGASGCVDFMRRVVRDLLPRQPVDVLVLSGRWSDRDAGVVRRLVEELAPHAREVVVTGPVPEYTSSLPRILARMDEGEIAPSDLDRHLVKGRKAVDASMATALAGSAARYVSLIDLLCTPSCLTRLADGAPVAFDYGHLTPPGSRHVAEALRPLVDRTR